MASSSTTQENEETFRLKMSMKARTEKDFGLDFYIYNIAKKPDTL